MLTVNFPGSRVECLGSLLQCTMVQINQDYYEDLTPQNFGALLDDLRAGKPVKIGSQIGRVSSEPEGGAKTLLDGALYDGSVVAAWKKAFEERARKAAEAKAAAAAAAAAAGTAPTPAAAAPVAAKPAAEPAPAAMPAPKVETTPVAFVAPPPGKAPGALDAARGGKADDLKLVWGIGPKLEKMLHGMGIFHFDQIAAWGHEGACLGR